jgi:hypothetical protein
MKAPVPISKSFLVLLGLSLAHLACCKCLAGEWLSEEFNCALTLPSGAEWRQPNAPNPAIRVLAQTSDQSVSVLLLVVPVPIGTKLDDRFIQGYEDGHYQAGSSKKLSGDRRVIQGLPAYRTTGEIYTNGNTAQQVTILWIAGDKLYSLVAVKRTGPPLEDPDVRAFLASFHFLKPPPV